MFLLFGVASIIFSLLNLVNYFKGKNPKLFRFISMSLLLLTVGLVYELNAQYVLYQDFNGLIDVTPPMRVIVWVFVVSSIIINSFTLADHLIDRS